MNEFINQALIFIGATVIIVPIFKQLGFGSVLGYLMAGVLVGPYALKLIHEAESVMHFAELGVVLLLFIIGLEIQPKKLWSMRKELVGLGFLQVGVTTLVFSLIGISFGLSFTMSWILGFALSLSSTAFALQYLIEKNQFKTTYGQSSFSILLAQDLVAIPVLAIIPAILISKVTSTSAPTLLTIVYFLAMITGLVLASRFLLRPLFRFIGSTHTQELFTATALFIVFGVAALTLYIGLSAALGTFIAGVLLADSEYRHELEVNIDPFKSLLMGLFFISVGMNVSLPLIFEQPGIIFGFSLIYIFLKMIIIYGVGRMFKLHHQNSKLMALAIGQGGEFAFVIFGMILSLRLGSPEIIAKLTAVITVSMALSSIFNILNEKLEARAPKREPHYDDFKDDEAKIIIAGFGRFGQIFGRVLKSQGIPFVAIDHDASQVDSLRKFGHKVYYGDASRKDILEKAGAHHAHFLILAVDDIEQSILTAKIAQQHFPQLKIYGRARNRTHAFEYLELGITRIKRETFDSALAFTGELLEDLGIEKTRREKIIASFKIHDEELMKEQFKVHKDEGQYISQVQQGQKQLEEVMEQEKSMSFIKP